MFIRVKLLKFKRCSFEYRNNSMKTWKTVQRDDTVDCIEHPLTGVLMPKGEFADEFALFLVELDGTTASDYFDFYFDRCSIICTAYRFRDDDSKQDFIDACIDLGLLPSFKETLQGENKDEQIKRQHKSAEDLVNDFKSLKSKEMATKYHSKPEKEDKIKYRSKAQQLQCTFQKLTKAIQECKDPEKKLSLENKLKRVITLMEHSM